MIPQTALTLCAIALTVAGSYFAAQLAIRVMVARLDEKYNALAKVVERHQHHGEYIIQLQTKVDILMTSVEQLRQAAGRPVADVQSGISALLETAKETQRIMLRLTRDE